MNREEFLARHQAAKRFLPEERELRTIRTSDIVARAEGEGDDEELRIGGHAAVFNEWANIGGWFLERIAPGAFDKTIDEADVRMLFNHNPDQVLARTKNGTLELSQDDTGLVYDGVINREDPQAVSTHAKIARGDVDQSSFAFRVIAEEWRDADDEFDLPQRTITEVQLFDVAPVTYPAYEGTDVGVRSAALGVLSNVLGLSERKREILLRAMEDEVDLPDGFAQAIDIVSPVFEALLRGELPEIENEEGDDEEVVEENTDEPVSSESEEESEPIGTADDDPEGEPAAEEAPEEVETEEETERDFAAWFETFTRMEGRVPSAEEIEDQFPSSSTQETSN